MRTRQAGFSLIELMVVMVIFLIVTGAVFGLLNVAQVRYRSEQQFLDSLQGARIALEQITANVHRAGFPGVNGYDTVTPTSLWVAAGGVPAERVAVPFVGIRGGAIDQTCLIDTSNPTLSTCTIPNAFELVIETDLDPENTITPAQVEWVYYRLDTPGNALASPPTGGGMTRTLYFRISPKQCGGMPWTPVTCPGGKPVGTGTPMVDNIINDPAAYAANPDEAVFRYTCASGATTCTPENIQEVRIVLRARAFSQDIQTRGVRALTLQSVARRVNPAK